MKKFLMFLSVVLSVALARADVYIINGERVEGEVHEINGQLTICTDEMCMIIPPGAVKVPAESIAPGAEPLRGENPQPVPGAEPLRGELQQTCRDGVAPPQGTIPLPNAASTKPPRLTQGYLKPHELISFLRGGGAGDVTDGWDNAPVWMILWIALLGGLLMNLTPCVLPMIPINLMIIGKSAGRGALYGLGIAIAYGIMGVLAAIGGMAFGEIQGNPWFNLIIALIFFGLSLSLFGVYFIDFSKHRSIKQSNNQIIKQFVFPFVMGAVSAVLAGACVAPILIAVLLLTAKLYAEGNVFALGLPFVFGLGMGLPWVLAGAGLKVLPKPGAWMLYVNKAFGLIVLGFSIWYGYLAYTGFTHSNPVDSTGTLPQPSNPNTPNPNTQPVRHSLGEGGTPQHLNISTPQHLNISNLPRPIFVDCWATWCKNCTAMEKTTFQDPDVISELKRYTVIRLQAEDISELRKLPGFSEVKGLPAFAIFE